MYRVLITGDTHGRLDSVLRLMENVPFDAVIHLGDYVRDAVKLEKLYKDKVFYSVKGNNDLTGETEKIIDISGHKILICHGHTYGADPLRLSLSAKEKGAEAVFFGHIHTPCDFFEDGVRIFSPGSPEYPRISEKCVGILEADKEYFKTTHYFL